MATLWERLNQAAEAAISNWRAAPTDPGSPMSIYTGLSSEQKDHIKRVQLLRKYYAGEHRKHLKRRMGPSGEGPDDNLVINISRKVVNKGVAFLFGKPISWEIPEGIDGELSSAESPAEASLAEMWVSKEWQGQFLQEVAMNGGITGTAYVQLVPQGEEEPPRLVNLDPAFVIPHWNPTDVDQVWAYELRYMKNGSAHRMIHTLEVAEDTEEGPGETTGFWTTFTEKLERGRWVVVEEPEQWPYEWPYIVPIKNLPAPNSFYGISDLEDADMNDAINKVASNLMRITRIYAHPQPWAKGFGKNDIPMDGSKFAMSSQDWASMGVLEMAQEMSSSFELLRFLRTSFADITQVPESDPDRMAIGAQSGFALRVLFGDLLDKTEMKRNTYGQAIVEINKRGAELMGLGEDVETILHWSDPLPPNAQEDTNRDAFELDAKLSSRERIAKRRGIDWDVEKARVSQEATLNDTLGQALITAFEQGQGAQL